MRLLIPFFACLLVLPHALGCGDSLDLGNSGKGGADIKECQTNSDGVVSCSACNAPGDRCAVSPIDPQVPRTQNCCCGTGANGGESIWQCFYNTQGCPSSPPELDDQCNLVDATCQYCTDVGAVVYTCANNYWQGGQRSSGC